MVSNGGGPLSAARRRAFVAFVLVALLVWWCARSSGFFFVVGLQGSASANLGPLLPAICGGLSAAVILLVADAAAGPVAGVAAVLLLVLTPGFLGLHRDSLDGPPLLALTLVMLAVMIHASRFSLAYGTLGAVGGVFVATEGIGLPLAAAAWALLQRNRENGRWQRVVLSLIPTAVVLWLAHVLGGAWPHGVVYGWRTDLSRAFIGASVIVANQLAPIQAHPNVHVFAATAAVTLIVVSVIIAWRRALVGAAGNAAVRAVFPVATLLVLALLIGLLGRAVLVQRAPDPDLAAMMPVVAAMIILTTVSLVTLWREWPAWGRFAVGLIAAGWMIAAATTWYAVIPSLI